MSDDNKRGLQSPFRRKLLMGMAALPALTMLPRPSFAQAPATSAINTTGLAVGGYAALSSYTALGGAMTVFALPQ